MAIAIRMRDLGTSAAHHSKKETPSFKLASLEGFFGGEARREENCCPVLESPDVLVRTRHTLLTIWISQLSH